MKMKLCRITASGRARYIEYLSTLEQVVQDAAREPKKGRGRLVRGLSAIAALNFFCETHFTVQSSARYA